MSNLKTKLPKSRSWFDRLALFIGGEPQDKEDLMEVLREAEGRHVLSSDMLAMIERILQVSEMQVREVMVPKENMIVLQKNSKFKDILPIVIESAHSRFPVVDSKKDVVGMLLAKDLLKFSNQDPEQFKLADIIRPAIFTPQSKRLDILLREFRVNRNHIAIVLDEYGHVAGLVTIEDVLEQIVGEIEDEYDIDEEDGHIKKLDDDSYIVKATTHIQDFNEYFHAHLSNKELDTVGGIVLKAFGHLPKRGESIRLENYRFKVLHSDHKRIYLFEVRIVPAKKKDKS